MNTTTPPKATIRFQHVADAVITGVTGPLDAFTYAYVSDGGTYLIASLPKWNDDLLPHDLIAVLRDGTVLPLRPNVNPEMVEQIKAAFAADQ